MGAMLINTVLKRDASIEYQRGYTFMGEIGCEIIRPVMSLIEASPKRSMPAGKTRMHYKDE